jgi:hypothetical protein
VLELREEAMVMCTKNNFEAGYVNGTLGRVKKFDADDGYPWITTSEGRDIKMVPQPWTIEEDGKVRAQIMQVPLRLAWAITVHKSQGMSLDAAEIDLRNAFTYGQGYVALSRVRSLQGMKVLGLNVHALLVDPRVVQQDERFREESSEAESAFNEMGEEEVEGMQQRFVRAQGGVWQAGAPEIRDTKRTLRSESTYELTKQLLLKELTARDIARERKMALSTIWSHVEKLVEDKEIGYEEVQKLIPSDVAWPDIYPRISHAFKQEGTERLKPVYEALGEQYDYDLIRLGRIFFTLEQR